MTSTHDIHSRFTIIICAIFKLLCQRTSPNPNTPSGPSKPYNFLDLIKLTSAHYLLSHLNFLCCNGNLSFKDFWKLRCLFLPATLLKYLFEATFEVSALRVWDLHAYFSIEDHIELFTNSSYNAHTDCIKHLPYSKISFPLGKHS